MKISKSYEETARIETSINGEYIISKIGLIIHSDKELKSIDEIKEYSNKLNELAKHIVKEELEKLKTEKGV